MRSFFVQDLRVGKRAFLALVCCIFAASIAPAGTPGGPCRRSQPVEAPPPRGPALELGSSEQLCPKCMYACTCCTPVPHPRYALPHVPKKNRKKEQRAKTSEKKTEQPISRCFVVPCGGVENFGGSLRRREERRGTIKGVGGRPAPGSDDPRAPGEERIWD